MKSKVYMIVSFIILSVTIGFIYSSTSASGNDPGTVQDPLVTKSYVDEKYNEFSSILEAIQSSSSSDSSMDNIDMSTIYSYIDAKISELPVNGLPTSNPSFKFEVIEVEAGAKLIADESTELILRSGQATAISNAAGNGISDITLGSDLITGDMVPLNHLVIIPRTDGRGLQTTSTCWIMIRGTYTVVKP